MKKEKQVRSYKRRTKSGKIVTVKAHTAKYEAADEKAKEVSKKPGAGKELEERKKKPVQLETPFGKEEEKKVLDEVTKEDEKTQKKQLSRLKNGVASKEKRLSELKGIYSSMKRSDPKRLKYANRIQKLQKDLIATKSALSHQEEVVSEKPNVKKTSKKVRPVGSGTNGPTPKKESKPKATKTVAKSTTSEPAFTAAEFKEWYRGTGSAADKKVAKALRAQLGRSGYRKLEDEAIDNYTSRGHLSMFKRVSGGSSTTNKTVKSSVKTSPKTTVSTKVSKTTKVSSASSFMDGYKDMNALREYAAQVMDSTSPYKAKTRKELKRMFDADQGKAGSHEKKFKKFLKDEWLPNKDNVQGDRNFYLGTKASKKRSVGTGTNGPEPKKTAISEQSLNSKGFKTFRMPQVGTLYLGKKGKGAYIKFKGKRNIQKADIDDYEDFITGHNGLTKAQKKQLSSLGYTEHEEY